MMYIIRELDTENKPIYERLTIAVGTNTEYHKIYRIALHDLDDTVGF